MQLEEIGDNAFRNCSNLKAIYVQDGCIVSVREAVKNLVQVLPPKQTVVGDSLLWDLRALGDVVLPEGVQRIGDYWFAKTDIRSVHISASVREIGREAFLECK